jgi:glycosyltransferase involved in cell wall biosynthesis
VNSDQTDTPAAPLRLVLLLQDLEYGGTQRYAIHLLKHLDRRLFTPELWVLRSGADMEAHARETGVECVWMAPSASWVSPAALASLAARLVRNRPNVLYTMTVVPNIWGRLFGRLARVPAIVSSWRDLYPDQHERWMWRLSHRIIANSEALKALMAPRYGVDPARVSVVVNGVDSDAFRPDHALEASEPTILFAGRLVREKDPVTLLRAFRLTLDRMPAARLEILGNGPLRSDLESLARREGMAGRVRFLPGVHDIVPPLQRAWVFAMPSAREASPNAVLEAMSCEVPVVGTRVGGIPELVGHEETGLLVPSGDPPALAEAFVRLLGDRPLRLAMGRRAREKALAEHAMGRMIRETERVLLQAAREVGLG